MWLLGQVSHHEHWSETGFLAGEAALNSLVAVESFKYTLRRQRPYQGDGSGSFFQSSGTSFPSEHSAAAWSVAGVIAHEYPGPFTKIVAYGLASLVDISRIRGHQHFPSDVLVGSVIGNLVAQDIYSRRHDPQLGGAEWRSISQLFRGDGNSSPANHGSPYVPLDSWIYPALDRLAAMGLIDSGFAGMKPWTRNECVLLLNEAGDKISGAGLGGEQAEKIYGLLEHEFRDEREGLGGTTPSARLESVYTRVMGISGPPLTDGYHFGQTIINDFGRPYAEGVNSVEGISGWATAGRWVGYIRAEYQHSPSAPPLSGPARQAISAVDVVPESPTTLIPAVNRVQLLDAYVGLNTQNWEVTFGRQSLWWGPGDGGPMMFSDNAAPINMFRVNRVQPFKLPWILGWLGPIRTEVFIGQLTGQEFLFNPSGLMGQSGQPLNPQPFIHGQMFSFKPTPNFEFAVFRTTDYGGPGYPLTLHTLVRSLFTTGNENPGGASKPGDRRSGVNFSYRLPALRKWVTFYGDGFTDDEFSPIAYADRSVWHAGIYLPQFPRINKLDLRVEGVYTNNPLGGKICCGFFYWNATWRSGYTNGGNLIGSWVGRDGQGAQAWSNYWFTPRNKIQVSFRHQKVGQDFIPGGGTLTDVGLRVDLWTNRNLGISTNMQYETWFFPVIRPGQQTNVSAGLQLTFWPGLTRHAKSASEP